MSRKPADQCTPIMGSCFSLIHYLPFNNSAVHVTFFHNSCPEYCLNEFWCVCLHFLCWKKVSKRWKSSFLLIIDLLAFRARVRLFKFSFKLLYCYMYFIICSLQITHFYRMFFSEFLALQKTCTHPTHFKWTILYLLKAKKVICCPKSVLRENKQYLTEQIFHQILWGINVNLHITVHLKETQKPGWFVFLVFSHSQTYWS